MLFVTKKVKWSAAHRLFNPTYSNEKNEEVFNKCNNIYGHGHNYEMDVTVMGKPDPNTGYVIDLKVLKQILHEEIVEKVDHKHLNFDVDMLRGIIPTVENLAVVFWNVLKDKITGGKLYSIRLYESDDSYVEYYGEPTEVPVYNNN